MKLNQLDKKQLTALLRELAGLRKENAEWLTAKLKGPSGIENTLTQYKQKIRHALCEDRINLKLARQYISDFRKISREPGHLAELWASYVQSCSWMDRQADLYEAFYDSMENAFKQTLELLKQKPEMAPRITPILEDAIHNSCEGYGHREILEDLYDEYTGKKPEDPVDEK